MEAAGDLPLAAGFLKISLQHSKLFGTFLIVPKQIENVMKLI
jgi:hypothetical protein